MKKTIYLVRHGQTLFNLLKKVQGWCDAPLTPYGIEQAKVAGAYFKKEGITFDHAYSSTSERASDTLELITDHPYKRLKGLKEWNFGLFEAETEALNPQLPYGDFFATYGGEREVDFRARVVNTVEEIMSQDDHNVVLAVSHGAAVAQFARHWEEHSAIGRVSGLKNCCVLKFEFDNGIFSLQEYITHDFDHLKPTTLQDYKFQ